ncbi:MAG: carbon-nitrogen hydrolase family protein [Ignavibacteria bacterium]|nr:carbon-nitrogen hydrolase family protein [Ignavibacteria bacterium]
MRTVRIAAVSFLMDDGPHTVDRNLERAAAYVRGAAERDADVVCLPEAVTTLAVPGDPVAVVAESGAAWKPFFASLAKKHRINLVAPYLVRAAGRVYNQATVFHRDGTTAGAYRKVQPNGAELAYTRPGGAFPVMQLDVGAVAVMLCMDMHFPEIARIYALKGADILFWPTVTHGPTQESLLVQLRARAIDNSLVIAESNLAAAPPYAPYNGRFRPGNARIVDHHGDIVAQTGRRHGFAMADVDLDEVRMTSEVVLLREPDHTREDLERLLRLDLYADEYARLARRRTKRTS